jgi:hypothetical protein
MIVAVLAGGKPPSAKMTLAVSSFPSFRYWPAQAAKRPEVLPAAAFLSGNVSRHP